MSDRYFYCLGLDDIDQACYNITDGEEELTKKEKEELFEELQESLNNDETIGELCNSIITDAVSRKLKERNPKITLSQVFLDAMKVGFYFSSISEGDAEDWIASEQCSFFVDLMIHRAYDHGIPVEGELLLKAKEIIDDINNHKYDPEFSYDYSDYHTGFLAGEILGYPTGKNIELAKKAILLFQTEPEKYHYFNEALEEVLGNV